MARAGPWLCENRPVVPEASYASTPEDIEPSSEGWFVVNAKEGRRFDGDSGAYIRFEGPNARFPQVGVNIGVLAPGQPACMYHGENEQEDFLVLAGRCLLLVEGEERLLEAWDFVHCPAWTEHVFVGAGDGPCAILAVGSRTGGDVIYPASELAQRHRAGVPTTTSESKEAYAGNAEDVATPYRDGWLPG